MKRRYHHYGWELSYYSGKTRAYLRHKPLPFAEHTIRLWQVPALKKRVGAQVMPVLRTPEGEWLQDTADIIATLEQRHPERTMLPQTPRQRIVALLLEMWGDEFWLPSALHYRWNFDENFETLFRPEGGRNLLPLAPRFLRDRIITRVARTLRGFLPGLGVTQEQIPLIERWTRRMCDALDAHFAEHPYLLGTRPSLGDFGLIGPLYAHLARDPYPARELVGRRPHLQAWVQRMQHPRAPGAGEWLADDRIPDTLGPLLDSACRELRAFTDATQTEAQRLLSEIAEGRGFPRLMGEVVVPLGDGPFRLGARPFVLWKLQRVRDAYAALSADAQQQVGDWLSAYGAQDWLGASPSMRLHRRGLRVVPADTATAAAAA